MVWGLMMRGGKPEAAFKDLVLESGGERHAGCVVEDTLLGTVMWDVG